MLSKTILLSLLASIACALRADSTLPSFALVGETTAPSVSTPAPQIIPTSAPADDDQPAPSKSTKLPASQSFNPSKAPAFTPTSGAPDFTTLPVFSSSPCASELPPSSSYVPTADLSIGQPIPTSTLQVPSNEKKSSSLVSAPTPTPEPENGDDDDEPCSDDNEETPAGGALVPSVTRPAGGVSATPTPSTVPEKDGEDDEPCSEEEDANAPVASATPLSVSVPLATSTSLTQQRPPFPTPNRPAPPAFPTGTGVPHGPEGHPGPGSGRPHPSARLSRYPSRPQPLAGAGPESAVGQNVAASTLCTLATQVRPTPTDI